MTVFEFIKLFNEGGPHSGLMLGASLFSCLAIALFFLRFWRMTADRLFLAFSWAFLLLGTERFLLVISPPGSETRSTVYVTRLIAFILIIVAIINKNRATKA